VHAGTIEGLRYPTLNLDLAARPTVATNWLNRSDGTGPVPPGSHIVVQNIDDVATQHPAGDVHLMLEGWAQSISPTAWTVAGNCVSNRIYDAVKVMASDSEAHLGKVQTAGSSLTEDAPAGSTTLTVTAVLPWTTAAADFPLDIEVSGIQVTVTDITGSTSPQTFTVTDTTVTKPLHAGDAVKVWHAGVISF
jgi:hypothetical protein